MSRLAKRIEFDDFIFFEAETYDFSSLFYSRKEFNKLVEEGKASGEFDGSKWMLYTGKEWVGINFKLVAYKYKSHACKILNVSYSNIVLMLKDYAMFLYGTFINKEIAGRIKVLKKFLEEYGEEDYQILSTNLYKLHEFLTYISISEDKIMEINGALKVIEAKKPGKRKLSPIINYLVIENEIKRMYSGDIDDETFVKWFPVFFWVEVTFNLPLRANEMLLTPYNCIERRAGDAYLTVRRTQLKKHKGIVKNDIDLDYKLFPYRMPDNDVIKTIDKYIELTKNQKRKYLFMYDETTMTNSRVALRPFNRLLSEFIGEKMIGNPDYDYVRYATGIEEFETVTAGDSRPIAMVNIYFSNFGADICMQLANHDNLKTSEGYYTNIDQIIMDSSIVRMQNRYNADARAAKLRKNTYKPVVSIKGCSSPKRLRDMENIEDCEKNGHEDECIGCGFYSPTEKELKEYEKKLREEIRSGSKKMIKLLNGILKAKDVDQTAEELFYSVQHDMIKVKEVADIKAEKGLEEWEETLHTQKTY